MCEYCDDDKETKIPLLNDCCDSDGVYIDGREVEVSVSYEQGYFNINYCPMCGRNLKERSNEF